MKKKGQKRMQGNREPNGRLSRRKAHVADRMTEEAFENQRVVLEARARHTGLPAYLVAINEAGRPNAGSVHGIMCLRKELSREQWDAAEWWIGKRAAWLRAIETPHQETGPSAGGDHDPERHAAFCRRAREEWSAILSCVQEASTETRSPLAAALDVFLTRQQHVEHMAGDLRIVLNAIHRRFLAARRKAA